MARIALVGLSLVLALGACGGDDTGTTAAPTTTSTTAAPTTTSATAAPTTTSMLGAAAGATASSEQRAAAGAVAIAGFAFVPSPVTVPAGGTVTWTNNDDAAHSVSDASPMGTPESKPLHKGDTFSITYPRPGTYPYVCGIHNYMQGSVEVKA